MADYVLAKSFGKSNIQDRLWYAKTDADKSTMLSDDSCKITLGDKVLVMADSKVYIYDGSTWKQLTNVTIAI